MGNVKDKYIKYEAAADQRVGRTVAGLDVNSVEFGVSPPIYVQLSTSDRTADICKKNDRELYFVVVPDQWLGVATLLTASIIYNRENMATAFPTLAKEELFGCCLGVEVPHNLAAVRVDVFYPFNNRAPDGTVLISLTGLPNATLLFTEITLLFREIGEVKARMDQLGNEQRATAGKLCLEYADYWIHGVLRVAIYQWMI